MYGRIATHNRVLAACFDCAAMGGIVAGLAIAPSLLHRKLVVSSTGALVGALLAEFYGAFDAFPNRGTPGKMLMRLRIAQANGRRPSRPALVWRWFLKYIPL